MIITEKKELIEFLEVIQLKGLDSRGKENAVFEDTILRFESNTGFVSAYGSNIGNSIFFHHTKWIDTAKHDEDFTLPIPDIKTWKKYMTDLQGDSVEIVIDSPNVILAGDDGAYYKIPLSSEQSINSSVYLAEGPLLEYDSEAPHLLVDAYSETPLNPDDRSRYIFDPQTLAQATESGKNVNTMTTVFTFLEDSINIKVGSIPSVNSSNGATFVYDNVSGVVIDDLKTGTTMEKDWVGVVGINPIFKALHYINPDKSYVYYKSSEHNLLFVGVHRPIDSVEDSYVWMVSPISNEEGSFIQTEEE